MRPARPATTRKTQCCIFPIARNATLRITTSTLLVTTPAPWRFVTNTTLFGRVTPGALANYPAGPLFVDPVTADGVCAKRAGRQHAACAKTGRIQSWRLQNQSKVKNPRAPFFQVLFYPALRKAPFLIRAPQKMSRPVPSLTTVWTPECSSIFHFYETSTKSCLPPEYDAVWDNNGYYSPGICFSGYTSGCSPTWYNDIEPGETAAHCVPRYVPPYPAIVVTTQNL